MSQKRTTKQYEETQKPTYSIEELDDEELDDEELNDEELNDEEPNDEESNDEDLVLSLDKYLQKVKEVKAMRQLLDEQLEIIKHLEFIRGSFKAERDKALHENSQLNKELEALRKQWDKAKATIAEEPNHREETLASNQKLEAAVVNLNKDLEQARGTISHEQTVSDNLRQQLGQAQYTIRQQEREIDCLKVQLSQNAQNQQSLMVPDTVYSSTASQMSPFHSLPQQNNSQLVPSTISWENSIRRSGRSDQFNSNIPQRYEFAGQALPVTTYTFRYVSSSMTVHHHYPDRISYAIGRTFAKNNIGIDTYHGTFPPSQTGPESVSADAYQPVRTMALEEPVVDSGSANIFISAFFEHGQTIILPIVPQRLFLVHRHLYHVRNIVGYEYSLSLEYALYAVMADVICPHRAEGLAKKAGKLLAKEMRKSVTTLGSIQASILLGWRECGSDQTGHFRVIANELAVHFGAHIDPSNVVSSTKMTSEEAEVRRLMTWGFFVFDRLSSLFRGTPCSFTAFRPGEVQLPQQAVYTTPHAHNYFTYLCDLCLVVDKIITNIYWVPDTNDLEAAAYNVAHIYQSLDAWYSGLLQLEQHQTETSIHGCQISLLRILFHTVKLYLIMPFLDLPKGIPGVDQQVVQACRNSLGMLIDQLQNCRAVYQGEGFPFGSGWLLVPAVRRCFMLFQVETHFEAEKVRWETMLKTIWKQILGSEKLPLPYEA